MTKGKKNNLAIWKINLNHAALLELSTEQAITKIITAHNSKEGLDENEKVEKIVLKQDVIEGKNVQIFNKQRRSNGWKDFIGDAIDPDKQDNNRNIFFNINNDFLCFIYDENDIFLITAGAGYHAIQDFIDENFPLEVAKKIFVGEFNYAETRGLTGSTYSKAENFRRSYAFSRQEAFGKIWKKLSGRIDPQVIEKTSELKLVIDPSKKNNAEMKSSFTFRKSVSFEEVVKLINAIQSLPDTSEEKHEKFKFLETLREVKRPENREKIKTKLLEKAYNILKNDQFEESRDFDFCHPSEPFAFFAGCNYMVDEEILEIEDYPRAEDVLRFIKEKKLTSLDNFDEFKKSFEALKFSFKKEEEDEFEISVSITKYFHGEIEIDGKTFFIVDAKYYEPFAIFLDTLLEDFIVEVFGKDPILIEDIPFLTWEKNADGKHMEGEFNILQAKQEDFYFGDKLFIGTEKGQIELFDLLHVKDEKTYIIQVKGRFGACIRDACSQIEIAAEVIEQDIKNDRSILKKYHALWKTKDGNDLTEDQFLDLFLKNERIYVLACSTSCGFTKEIFEKKKSSSHIAQFEVLGLSHLFKGKGYQFKIHHIKRN